MPDRKYSKWIDKISALAIKLVVISLFLLLVIQGLMQFDVVRGYLVPTEYWEGKPLHMQSFER